MNVMFWFLFFFSCMGLELDFVLYNVIESFKPATWSSTHTAPLPVKLAFSGGKRLQPFDSPCLSFCCLVALNPPGLPECYRKKTFSFFCPKSFNYNFIFPTGKNAGEVWCFFFSRSHVMIVSKHHSLTLQVWDRVKWHPLLDKKNPKN